MIDIAFKVEDGERLTFDEGVAPYNTNDLSRMNAAFFTTNSIVGFILLLTFGGSVFLAR